MIKSKENVPPSLFFMSMFLFYPTLHNQIKYANTTVLVYRLHGSKKNLTVCLLRVKNEYKMNHSSDKGIYFLQFSEGK